MLTECPPPGPAAPRPRQPADPGSADSVAAALLAYLGTRLRTAGLGYSAAPEPLCDGWETFLYAFRLKGPGLPPPWDGPLVVRIHANGQGLGHARHEFEVPRHLAALGYPVPRPVLLEEADDVFGGPFLVLERVPGPTLLHAMLEQPWNLLHFPAQMAEAHARLHALPSAGFPGVPPGGNTPGLPFLDRQLAALAAAVGRHGLGGLAAGLAWLRAHRPADPAEPSILHLDFHPLNLVEHGGAVTVLDWTYSDVGDPHADVAMTLLILECAPAPGGGLWERLAELVGRPVLAGWYHHCYGRRRPLDEARLGYYRAWAALCRLARYGGWLRAGPEASGCKPAVLEHLSGELLGALCGYFRRWTGVEVSL